MRMTLTTTELMSAVLLPAALLTVPLVSLAVLSWKADIDRREAPIRREIARNFADKWGRCDLASNWDKTVPCVAR